MIMTSRTFIVIPDGHNYRIHVRTVYEKSNKRRLDEVRGYPSENSAQNDVKRLKSHLMAENGRHFERISAMNGIARIQPTSRATVQL